MVRSGDEAEAAYVSPWYLQDCCNSPPNPSSNFTNKTHQGCTCFLCNAYMLSQAGMLLHMVPISFSQLVSEEQREKKLD
jgi:hypothetical protein